MITVYRKPYVDAGKNNTEKRTIMGEGGEYKTDTKKWQKENQLTKYIYIIVWESSNFRIFESKLKKIAHKMS